MSGAAPRPQVVGVGAKVQVELVVQVQGGHGVEAVGASAEAGGQDVHQSRQERERQEAPRAAAGLRAAGRAGPVRTLRVDGRIASCFKAEFEICEPSTRSLGPRPIRKRP